MKVLCDCFQCDLDTGDRSASCICADHSQQGRLRVLRVRESLYSEHDDECTRWQLSEYGTFDNGIFDKSASYQAITCSGTASQDTTERRTVREVGRACGEKDAGTEASFGTTAESSAGSRTVEGDLC